MKIALGLSGGVDSAVSAKLLKEAGHEVVAVFMECWRAPGCRVDQDRKDALAIATQLGIEYQVLDFKTAYRERVVETMFELYQQGLTPNPDILCNLEIKFGLFYDWAMRHGFDAIATGHYARLIEHEGVKKLVIPKDVHKDQTYFLYQVPRAHFSKVMFPLQDLTKAEVRQLAHHHQLAVADKPDSTGICFIGELDMHQFLLEKLGSDPGQVVLPLSSKARQIIRQGSFRFRQSQRQFEIHELGLVVGTHPGLAYVTIGQRVGHYLDGKILKRASQEGLLEFSPEQLPELFAIQKHRHHNIVVIGRDEQCYGSSCVLESVIWHDKVPNSALARIRHGGKLTAVSITRAENDWQLQFETPVRALAPGQSVVLYSDQGVVLGGGVIKEY